MDVEKALLTRRSVRRFTSERVSGEDLEALLEAGRWAPSGLNNQPWRVVVIEGRGKAEELSACTRYGSIVRSAPLLLAVFLDREASYDRDKDLMAVGAFIQNILLAAHARGLGAVWLGEILKEKRKVGELLDVPGECELAAVLAIGYPAEEPGSASRKPLHDIVLKRF
ncbi:MAG: nitroreductase [Actinobacteria bacterium]|nr:nitroreductase [Actinomycetota bacterium]